MRGGNWGTARSSGGLRIRPKRICADVWWVRYSAGGHSAHGLCQDTDGWLVAGLSTEAVPGGAGLQGVLWCAAMCRACCGVL